MYENIDWTAMRQKYVTGDWSFNSLAAEYGVSARAVSYHAKHEGWREAKSQYRRELIERTEAEIAEKTAGEISEKLLKLQSAADMMASAIEKALIDEDQFYLYIVSETTNDGEFSSTETQCKRFDKADTKAMRDIVMSIKELAQTIRSLYGLPTMQEKEAMEIARARLELDKRRTDGANAGDVTESGVIVLSEIDFDSDEQPVIEEG